MKSRVPNTVYDSATFVKKRKAHRRSRTKKNEVQEESRLKLEFISSVSHDLRTPLNVITGYIQLLLDERYGTLSYRQREALSRISDNVQDLLYLVNDVLDLSKSEAEMVSVKLADTDINRLVYDIVTNMRPLFDRKGISLQYIPASALPVVKSDPVKIKRILLNLVSNALKFTQRGGITVTTEIQSDRKKVIIRIKDTGIGIAIEEISKIFEPFYQAGVTLREAYGGVGLGLAIVRRLTELLRGKIEVESKHGDGAAFSLHLPFD
jgi:signal transduction histidine kinase